MSTASDSPCVWSEETVAHLNAHLGVQHDDDVTIEDWPVAMASPDLVDAALDAYDIAESPDERALIVELLLNTFEYSVIERDGNPDWRRTLDRIERDFDEHAEAVRRWAEPDDGNPWLISHAMQSVLSWKRPHA